MNRRMIFISAVFLFTALLSCEDPTSVGESVIPDDDELEIDSIIYTDFIINSIADDTLYTSGSTTNFIGEIQSSTFGKSIANFYSELRYITGFETVTTPVVDSAKIYLQISGFQGDESTEQSLEVYTLAEEMVFPNLIDTGFMTDEKIGEFTMRSFENLDTLINGETSSNHLQTELDLDFAQSLLEAYNNETVTNNAELHDFVKGIAVKPLADGNGKGLFAINNSTNSVSGVRIFYQNDEDESRILNFNFQPVNVEEDTLSNYTHYQMINDYSQGANNIETQLNNYSPTGYPIAYVQGGNGVLAELDFSSLTSQIDSSNLVNGAELVVRPHFVNDADTILLPPSLTLYEEFRVNDDGEKTGGMIDIAGNGLDAFEPGRIYDNSSTGSLGNDEDGYFYIFYLPDYIHGVVEEELEPKLYIGVPNRATSFNGFWFDTDNDIQLTIRYSITNN